MSKLAQIVDEEVLRMRNDPKEQSETISMIVLIDCLECNETFPDWKLINGICFWCDGEKTNSPESAAN